MRVRSASPDFENRSKRGLYYNACINSTARFREQSSVQEFARTSRKKARSSLLAFTSETPDLY